LSAKRALGREGEEIACRELKRMGYKVIEKNFRCREGEIDIVAEHDGYICFIEVKARTTSEFGVPEEAVTLAKRRRIIIAATLFMQERGSACGNVRFDVASVDLRDKSARILANAFDADSI
jgi:putative endonuclease